MIFCKTLYKTTSSESPIEINTRLFTERVMRRLTNYNRLLDIKIEKFDSLLSLGIKPRVLFILPDASSFVEYLNQKIKDKIKRDRLKTAKMLIKINAALIMSISFILIARTMKQMLVTETKCYKLRKATIEKAKRTRKKNKRRAKVAI